MNLFQSVTSLQAHTTFCRIFRRARATLLAGLAMVSTLAGCASAPLAGARADGPAFREEAVNIPEKDLTLKGVLFTPASSPAMRARRPAIVLMHGCAGMVDARGALAPRHRDWAERFARWGFVTLLTDSFNPRGVKALCELKDRPIHPWTDRTLDAYAALDYLVSRSDVDPNAVFVLGWSHGGSTVMSVVRREAPGRRADGPHFKAAIAFYPGCIGPLQQKSYQPSMPLLILHGEADDWTPAQPCVDLAHKLGASGLPVQTITYPNAHHAFDAPTGQVHFVPNVWNPRAPGERGAHVGPNPQARLAAIGDVQRFVNQMLRP
jgi:dienelactone hydrolase